MADIPLNDYRLRNRGPLLTTFTPASTCLATTSAEVLGILLPASARDTNYYVGYLQGHPRYQVTTDSINNPCLPPASDTRVALFASWFYSPAICPSAYYLGVTLETGRQNEHKTNAELLTTVTAWVCCPS